MLGVCPHCQHASEPGFPFCPYCGRARPSVQASEDPLIGRTLCGGYVLLEPIGTGGMGRVYRAEQRALGRSVAVKVIHPHLVHDALAASRFVNEAHAASRLNHPNVVSVIDFGRTDDGLPFIVMEYLRGPTLAKVVEKEGLLSMARVVDIMRQTLEALTEAHEIGMVHRDLKPANIALEPTRTGSDFVKVLDFGLAQITAGSSEDSACKRREVVGTPAYMSPEQAAGATLDHRSDLFSAGVILYELTTGLRLSRAETALAAVVERMIASTPSQDDIGRGRPVPEPFVPVVLKAIATDPAARYASAVEFRQALEDADRRVVGQCVRPTIPIPPSSVPCPSCGAPVPPKDRFCGACGTRVTPTAPAPIGFSTVEQTTAAPVSGVRRGRHTTRLQLRASSNTSDLQKLHELRLRAEPRLHAVRVVGEHGVGKTTLLREFLLSARSTGDACAQAGPDPWQARPPCWALRKLLASLAGLHDDDLPGITSRTSSASVSRGLEIVFGGAAPRDLGISPSEARTALRDALRWGLQRAAAGSLTGRVVVGIDDIDRIDGPSRNALLDLIADPPQTCALVVATKSLQAQVDWPASTGEQLIAGWDRKTVERVLSGFGGDIALPNEGAAGVLFTPLYVEHLIRFHFEGGENPPVETSDLIARRMERLPVDARKALHAMTVLGDRVRLEDVHALLAVPAGQDKGLSALAQAGMVDRDGNELRWTHPLLIDVASSVTPIAARRELRAKAGVLLAARNAPLEVLAVQAREAEQWFEALFLIEQAAERATSLGDSTGKTAWLQMGYETAQRGIAAGGIDDPEQAMVSFGRKLGDALLDDGRLAEADMVLREVLAFIEPSSVGRVQILRGLARVQHAGARSGSGDAEVVVGHAGSRVSASVRNRSAGNAG